MLQTHYQQKGFINKLGEFDGHIAKYWRSQLKNEGIGAKEMDYISNNLSKIGKLYGSGLPDVNDVINVWLNEKRKKHVINSQMYKAIENMPTNEDIMELRERTEGAREKAITAMRDLVG